MGIPFISGNHTSGNEMSKFVPVDQTEVVAGGMGLYFLYISLFLLRRAGRARAHALYSVVQILYPLYI